MKHIFRYRGIKYAFKMRGREAVRHRYMPKKIYFLRNAHLILYKPVNAKNAIKLSLIIISADSIDC